MLGAVLARFETGWDMKVGIDRCLVIALCITFTGVNPKTETLVKAHLAERTASGK